MADQQPDDRLLAVNPSHMGDQREGQVLEAGSECRLRSTGSITPGYWMPSVISPRGGWSPTG
jgi:hypothetical protein